MPLFRDSGSVKVGRALKERSRAALKRREEITLSLGREPTVGELAQSLGIEAAEAAMLINASMPVMSLTVGEDAGEQLDVPVASPEDEISDLIALRQAVDSLDKASPVYKTLLTQQQTKYLHSSLQKVRPRWSGTLH